MAKLEQVISGDFYEVLGKIERGIVEGSMSASLEEFSDFESGTARCSVCLLYTSPSPRDTR